MTQKYTAAVFISIWSIWMGLVAAKGQEKATSTDEKQQMLIEAGQLLKKLKEPNLRILDVRTMDDYAKGHIPSAVRVDVNDWKTLATSDNGLHDEKSWSQKLKPFGITESTHVIVYGSKLSDTARIWWLLKYLGVRDVSILNGGWEWWIKEDRPTEITTPKISAIEFKPNFQADRLEEIDSLKKSLKTDKLKIVDTRSIEEFTGKEVRGKRGGHIPGATHLEWKELIAKDGRFKTTEQLKELFRKRGILPEETAVCY